jgi:subtilisin family serine protease
VGHGTHVLSTAGGSFVQGASVLGHGTGTAAGGSPSARVASYKACYKLAVGCSEADILDGVHVLSLSVGGAPLEYLDDLVAVGALYAVQRGVTVVCSAGNDGPKPRTVTNVAPVRAPRTGTSRPTSTS